MARIRYQPATKTKGFQPVQLTKDGISRMREETNRVVGGMQQNLKAEQEQQKKNLDAMRDNAAYTEQITKENRAIEVQNLKNEQLSITQTAQRDQQQAQYDANAAQTILTSIQDFSVTAAKKAAANTAKQLKDQTDAANAVDIAPLLLEDGGRYEEAVSNLQVGAQKQLTEDVIEGAESGEPLDATFKKLASNAGLGAIGKRILANRLYESKHGIFTDRAFGSDEKIYEINGKKFSGLEALNDRQMTAVVQAQVTRDLARDMRETLGVTELLYFTKGKTEVEKKNALQQERSGARGIQQDQSMMLDNANVLLSNYTASDSTNAYSEIVVATRNYTTANTSMVNAIKMASTKEEAQAIRDAVITGQNGKSTTWGKRYSQLADEAEQDRVERINSDTKTARIARQEAVKAKALDAYNSGGFTGILKTNPLLLEKELTEGFASEGLTLPQYLKNEIANATTGFNEDEINRYTRSGAEVPEERINRATGTHQTKLKALNEAAQLRKFGGDLGKKALSALDAIAKEAHKIGVDGATTPDAVLTGAAFKRRWMDIWKEQGFGSQDPTTNAAEIAKTTAILNEERAKDTDNPQGRFYSKPDATNNSVVFPNLFPSTKDYQQLKTLVDKKFAAGRSIGEIASTPSLLATPAELATLSQQSQTSNNFRYPPLIMYAAAKNKNAPSEIANEQIKANNLAFGENTPLIQPNIVTKAMDEASPADAKLINSIFRVQNTRGYANYTGTANRPENMRSTFRSASFNIDSLTDQDYNDLAYAISSEAALGTDDEFGVAANILTRFKVGGYGNTISEIINAPGQYEGVYKGLSRPSPEIAARLKSPEGKARIQEFIRRLDGRTEFKGQTQLKNRVAAEDPMFDPAGNFYHYAGQY
tara:strand:- start:43 stop:2679 length:2637 start_codon:yes stop_codon:yes gene_type:complete